MATKKAESGATGGVPVDQVLAAFTRLRRQNDLLVASIARQHGMNSVDFRALEFVHSHSHVTPRGLAEYLAHSLSATTTIIDHLVASGYAQRVPNPDDGRSVRLTLTDVGTEAVDEATALYTAAFEASLPVRGRNSIAVAFIHLADALAAVEMDHHSTLN